MQSDLCYWIWKAGISRKKNSIVFDSSSFKRIAGWKTTTTSREIIADGLLFHSTLHRLSIYPPIHISLHLSIHPFICPSIYPKDLFIYPSICSSIYPSVHPSIHLSIPPSIHPSIYQFIHAFLHQSIHLLGLPLPFQGMEAEQPHSIMEIMDIR